MAGWLAVKDPHPLHPECTTTGISTNLFKEEKDEVGAGLCPQGPVVRGLKSMLLHRCLVPTEKRQTGRLSVCWS